MEFCGGPGRFVPTIRRAGKVCVLNACYSEAQAKAIARHIDYVIGMQQAIGDTAAIAFSAGFYQALGDGRNIEEAYKMGSVKRIV